jgi:hypothetical protein
VISKFPFLFRALLPTLLLGSPILLGHDLFLEPTAYTTRPKDELRILVYNGSFPQSINPISRSVVEELVSHGPSGKKALTSTSWEETDAGERYWRSFLKTARKTGEVDLSHTSNFEMTLPEPGSHVVGISLYASRIALEPADFLEYLATEAYCEISLPDYGITEQDDFVRERYTKTAKTIIQTGDQPSDAATTPLGLVAEIVPLANPALIRKGDELKLSIRFEGKPLAGQTIAVGRKQETLQQSDEDRTMLVSDQAGIITLPVTHSGVWWLKFIHLRPAPKEDSMDFESFWGTLTFEIKE